MAAFTAGYLSFWEKNRPSFTGTLAHITRKPRLASSGPVGQVRESSSECITSTVVRRSPSRPSGSYSRAGLRRPTRRKVWRTV